MRSRRALAAAAVALTAVVGLTPALPGAQSAPTVRSGSFRALTYNVAGLPEPLSGSEPAVNSPLISPLLNAYDLVLLQENWQDVLHDQREQGLAGDVPPIMYHHLVVGQADHEYRSEPAPHPHGTDISRAPPIGPTMLSDGLNRLSRFAFGDLTRVMWTHCFGDAAYTAGEEALAATGLGDALDTAGLGAVNDEVDGGAADCMAQKGFSVARTELAPGVLVDVYNLHADAGGDDRDVAAREQNFLQLADFVRAHSAGVAVILGGDTNLHTGGDRPRDGAVWSTFLRDTGLSDVCSVVACGADSGEIDKFAFRSSAAVKLVPQTHAFEREQFTHPDTGAALSDHEPLAVTFKWIAGRER